MPLARFLLSSMSNMRIATVVAALLLFFYIRPVPELDGGNMPDAAALLAGFADPALVAVLALLVIGQGMVRTGALDHAVRRLIVLRRHHPAGAGCVLCQGCYCPWRIFTTLARFVSSNNDWT